MATTADLWAETQEALARVWFVQSVEETERTDHTLSVRLWIRADLFVQAFVGELSQSLYFALIQSGRRIFGIDREAGQWHVHPFGSPHQHESLPEEPGPEPLREFLARVEELLLTHDML